MSVEPKKRRGRPAKSETAKLDKEPKSLVEPKEPKSLVDAAEQTKNIAAPAKRGARQRARPIPTTTTLSIASYGRRPTTENIVITAEAPSVQRSDVQDEPVDDPIVLSLPISDALESKLSAETLDVKLTAYRPDVLLSPKVPKGLLSMASVGAEYQSSGTPTTLERCEECTSTIGPCESCINRFNAKTTVSLDAYRTARAREDAELMIPIKEFQNVQIEDTPIEQSALDGIQYNPNLIEPGPVDLTDTPRAYTDHLTARAESFGLTKIATPTQRRVTPVKNGDVKSSRAAQTTVTNVDAETKECMWHLLPFEGPAVGLPLSFNETTQTFQCIGNFCSLECAYAYRLEHKSAEACPIRLLHLAHSMRSDTAEKLKPAPPRQVLKRFGGTMDYETFLKSVNWFTVRHQPFVFVKESVECFDDPLMYRSMSGIGHTNNFVNPTSVSVSGTTTELVRKRDKPHPNVVNQWESSIQRSRKRN